jgi:hypothetical protein
MSVFTKIGAVLLDKNRQDINDIASLFTTKPQPRGHAPEEPEEHSMHLHAQDMARLHSRTGKKPDLSL